MVTHSQGSYKAFRSGRNAPTHKEMIHRARVAEACRDFCNEPFGTGCEVTYTLADYNREIRESSIDALQTKKCK